MEKLINGLFYEKNLRRIAMTQLLIFLSVWWVNAQETTLSGKVTTVDGSPIPDVTVVAKGTSIGTITDLD
jgi:hypothetical protein